MNAQLRPVTKAALTIKAWRAYLEGREVKLLRYGRANGTQEIFPSLSGQ